MIGGGHQDAACTCFSASFSRFSLLYCCCCSSLAQVTPQSNDRSNASTTKLLLLILGEIVHCSLARHDESKGKKEGKQAGHARTRHGRDEEDGRMLWNGAIKAWRKGEEDGETFAQIYERLERREGKGKGGSFWGDAWVVRKGRGCMVCKEGRSAIAKQEREGRKVQ